MRPKSLRGQLLAWLLVPLTLVGALDVIATYRSGAEAAGVIEDRLLLGSARTIAEQVGVSEGRIDVSIPPAALEMLDGGQGDRVYYRVSTHDGRLVAGYLDLDVPDRTGIPEEWHAFDAVMRGEPVRVVTFFQPVFEAPSRAPVVIEVARTQRARESLTRQFWLHSVRQQLLMLVLGTVLVLFALRRGLDPVLELRDRMLKRQPGSTELIAEAPVPSELKPLVAALNQYLERLDRHLEAHNRFIADASHQLRTPLTVLNTQLNYVLRLTEGGDREEGLVAMRQSLQGTIRLANQLLALTEVEGGVGHHTHLEIIDICPVVQRVIEDLALLARSRNIDLGYECATEDTEVRATEHMVQILASNLVDNSVRYTQPGGIVTARIVRHPGAGLTLEVEDNGPGIPEAERKRVFARFYRLHGRDLDGCGLGLSIVEEIAVACGAHVELTSPLGGQGLVARVHFPPLAGVVNPAPDNETIASLAAA